MCTSPPVGECYAVQACQEEVTKEPKFQNVVDVIKEQKCNKEITTLVDTTTNKDCNDITEQNFFHADVSVVSVDHTSNIVKHTSDAAGIALPPPLLLLSVLPKGFRLSIMVLL